MTQLLERILRLGEQFKDLFSDETQNIYLYSNQKNVWQVSNLQDLKHPSVFFHRDLRFIEVIENVCQRLLEYNLHKERTGSNRFAKVSQCPFLFCFSVSGQLYIINIYKA